MPEVFSLPEGIVRRFAVVKLWPDIQTAEDECIARLKIAARSMNIECIEIHADGSLLTNPLVKVSKSTVDFVLHLHYDTPKRYDAFSFVALWNPLRFYHEWGYARCSRNLTTHDDFISCSATAADDHVLRMIRGQATHLPAVFNLYHSTAGVVHPPSLGEGKLFYAGINWEAISGGKSRHQEVLKRLDKTGLMSIYGPQMFQGVKVWAGYESYVDEVPFDGISMIDEISRAGVALVLSSQAHKDSELMSNRLFESIAAGALVICDENPFAKRFFGDALLYIDGRTPVEQMVVDITRHLDWARNHRLQALAMIRKAQAIFTEQFTLTRNLADLYSGLLDRRRSLLARQNPPDAAPVKISLNLLMPAYSEATLRAHVKSVEVQEYQNFSATLYIDACDAERYRETILAALQKSRSPIKLVEIDFWDYGIHPEIKAGRKLGQIFYGLLLAAVGHDAFVVVAPNETLFSNHLGVLAGALQRDPYVDCAATAVILIDGDAPVHAVHELIDFGHVDRAGPPGYGRFIFRMAGIPDDIHIALPYLDGRPLAVLAGGKTIDQQLPATVTIDLATEFPARTWDEAAENEVIRSFSPDAFKLATGFGPRPQIRCAAHAQGGTGDMTIGQFGRKLFNRRWVGVQVDAIRKQGLAKRMQVFRRKLGL
ncbi:MAG: glycosyltransferase family 1 protein [Pseudomonadota bacterium]